MYAVIETIINRKEIKNITDKLSKEVREYKKDGSCNKNQFIKIVSLSYACIDLFIRSFYKDDKDNLIDDFCIYCLSKLEKSINLWDENKDSFAAYFAPIVLNSFWIYKDKH